MARLERNIPDLKELKNATPKKRKTILATASGDLIDCICDCCTNVVKGNLKISTAQKKRLVRHAKTIRFLAKKGTSVKRRKQILIQKGGFLPTLIGPILLAASTIIGSLLNK